MMDALISLGYGEGRTKLSLAANRVGEDYVIYILGEGEHIGAIGIGVYDDIGGRTSSSVITIAGHRDDRIAKREAERVSRHTKHVTVLVAGVHLDRITEDEISTIIKNSERLIDMFLERIP
jgi:hypothetical protein